jgi:hypothetical protein
LTANRYPNSFNGSYPKKHNKREKKLLETALESARKDIVDSFTHAPLFALASDGYSAPTGTTGDIDLMRTQQATFEYHIKGTQTIVAPVWVAASGLNLAMDLTADDGVELTNGVGARCSQAFTVGTDPAFYAECTLTLADVSGTDDCAFGFRKAEAYQANIDDYNDGAWLNCISGNIKAETILANAATVTSSTLTTVADAGTVTLRVEVDAAGACRFLINGTEYTSSVTAFAFASGAVVVPFLFHLHDTDINNTCYLTSWKVGRL